ncbi:YceI family protein [Nonomuraea sp. NPDC049152]|uniref:YceI family protein n=1 Tax=Nonomuraea sp. NPDC049152 TaxID=3154350 RepID=UPI0033E059AE
MDATYTLGPESGRLLVKTSRTGLGAKAGHDLTIEATRWHGEATIDMTAPAGSSVTVEVDVASLEVRQGTGGVKPLTDADRAEIGKILREKILRTDRFPTITFRSTQAEGTAESFHVEGDLTIVGVTRPVTVEGRLAEGRASGSTTVVQSRWGIRPYSAFFGALKLGDDVEVRFDLALTPGG